MLVSIPKPGNDHSRVEGYKPIALATTLSKLLEWCILIQFRDTLSTSDLQFEFKPGLSTALCTVVSRMLFRTGVHLYLDASLMLQKY